MLQCSSGRAAYARENRPILCSTASKHFDGHIIPNIDTDIGITETQNSFYPFWRQHQQS